MSGIDQVPNAVLAANLAGLAAANMVADHVSGTAFYQRDDAGSNWDALLADTEPVELWDIEEPSDDELAAYADLDGIELDELVPDDLVIEPAPEWLDAVLYGSDDDDDDQGPRVPWHVIENLRGGR